MAISIKPAKYGMGVFINRDVPENAFCVVTKYAGRNFKEPDKRYGIATFKEFIKDKLSEKDIRFIITHMNRKVDSWKKNNKLYGYNYNDIVKQYKDEAISYCGSLLNHSNDPNCTIAQIRDLDNNSLYIVANRALSEGEELTLDYGAKYWDSHIYCDNVNEMMKKHTPTGETLIDYVSNSKDSIMPFVRAMSKTNLIEPIDITNIESNIYSC